MWLSLSPHKRFHLFYLFIPFSTGMPFNQLGTLAGSKFYNVEATYYYLRWWETLVCTSKVTAPVEPQSQWGEILNRCLICASIQSEAPFEGAYGNLKRLFDKAAKMYHQVKKQEMKKLSPARQRWEVVRSTLKKKFN